MRSYCYCTGGEDDAAEGKQCYWAQIETEVAPAHGDAGRIDQRRQYQQQHDFRRQFDFRQTWNKSYANSGNHQQDRGCNIQPLCGDRNCCQQPHHQQQRLHGRSHMRFATMFTVSASTTRLKKNDKTPCNDATRRMTLLLIATSETCEVMPITSEK